MAILFYEGLPGAGKSYEAMATQIIPFLQKGREVVAYIEGLEHERIAEAAGMEVERVRELLHVLDREDMRPRESQVNGRAVVSDGLWIEKVRDNAFHVFDEAQNWWPNRLKATEALTQFVSEHRHRGMDVLLMGQSLKDVLALWRRRVDQKFTFLKLTALGSDKRYRVSIYKGQGNDEFVKVTDKVGKYDPKYFGTYKSHVSADTNTATYTDKRANFIMQWARWAVPLCIGLTVWGGWKAWSFFHPAPVVAAAGKSGPATAVSGTAAAASVVAKGEVARAAPDTRSPQERHFADLTSKYRIRLAGLLQGRSHIDGIVEWLDGGTRVMERLSLDQLRELGVAVLLVRDTVRLSVGDWVELATMWPVEADGRVSENRIASMKPQPEGAGLPASQAGFLVASSGSGLPAGLTVIEDRKATPDVAPPVEQQPQRVGSFRR